MKKVKTLISVQRCIYFNLNVHKFRKRFHYYVLSTTFPSYWLKSIQNLSFRMDIQIKVNTSLNANWRFSLQKKKFFKNPITKNKTKCHFPAPSILTQGPIPENFVKKYLELAGLENDIFFVSCYWVFQFFCFCFSQ